MAVPTYEYIENGTHYKLWNCPYKFIPDSIKMFVKIYNYHTKFTGAEMPPYNNVSCRFLIAYHYFESCMNKFCEEMYSKRGSK